MKKAIALSIFLALIAISSAVSDSLDTKEIKIQAIRLEESVVVDGILSEPVWGNGGELCDFCQREPDEGAPSTEKTEVRIAYNDDALYIGARMYDSAPDSIVARLGRHDEWVSAGQGDLVGAAEPAPPLVLVLGDAESLLRDRAGGERDIFPQQAPRDQDWPRLRFDDQVVAERVQPFGSKMDFDHRISSSFGLKAGRSAEGRASPAKTDDKSNSVRGDGERIKLWYL